MIEIRFHGRGGQGSVVASELLARAAIIEGRHASAFPFFGSERRGAPVAAFCRIDDRPIRVHSSIYEPDYVVVLDPHLIEVVDVLEGIREDGKILVNFSGTKEELGLDTDREVTVVDAVAIAVKHHLGSITAPIVNTAMVGAFAGICPEVSIEAVMKAIREAAPAKREENAMAAKEAYDIVMEAS